MKQAVGNGDVEGLKGVGLIAKGRRRDIIQRLAHGPEDGGGADGREENHCQPAVEAVGWRLPLAAESDLAVTAAAHHHTDNEHPQPEKQEKPVEFCDDKVPEHTRYRERLFWKSKAGRRYQEHEQQRAEKNGFINGDFVFLRVHIPLPFLKFKNKDGLACSAPVYAVYLIKYFSITFICSVVFSGSW